MLNIRPVKKEDFDNVYPLLQQIPAPIPIAKETWRNLFYRQWDCQTEPLGYVLLKENEIVGYISLIVTQREINGKRREIVDLSSWSVNKKCGGHAMQMLSPFIEDQNKTFRCFTPAKSVNMIFRRFGFQELNGFMQIVPFWMMSMNGGYQISFQVDEELLTKEEKQIHADHRKFNSVHFVIKKGHSHCYVIGKRILKKSLPFLHVHYVSDKKIFTEALPKLAAKICGHYKTLGVIVYDHCVGNKAMSGAIRKEMQAKPLYRSQALKPEDIDSLYSEFFLLDF